MNSTKNKILEYCEIYENEVLPKFRELELIRLNIKKELNKKALFESSAFICTIILLILGAIGYLFSNNDTDLAYGIFLASSTGSILTIILTLINYFEYKNKQNKKYINLIKETVLKSLLKTFGDINWHAPETDTSACKNTLILDEQLNKSGLFLSYNTRYIDDEFDGTYKGIPFKISETKLIDILKKRYPLTVFKGIIISFKFNKTIKNRTIIATKGDFTKKNQIWFTMLATILSSLQVFKHGFSYTSLIIALVIIIVAFIVSKSIEKKDEALDRVLLEDPQFSKRFDVYSSNQVEARYLLTTSFMQRFYNLKTAFKAKNVKCSFYGDTLMIAINTKKNLFELGNLNKSLLAQTAINEFYRELDSIYKMIDYFKLDENTGL